MTDMETLSSIIPFAIRFFIASGLLMILYWVVWRKQSSYFAKRLYLLSLPLVALIISILQVEVYKPEPVIICEQIPSNQEYLSTEKGVEDNVSISQTQESTITEEITTLFSAEILFLVYALVVIGLFLPFAFNLFLLKKIRKKIEKKSQINDVNILMGEYVQAPFSFHRTIYMPLGLTNEQHRMILMHEQAHILHKHYIDVWISETITRFFCWNPVLWWVRDELRNVHEFEADSEVLANGEDVYAYQTILIEEVMHGDIVIANGFNHSFIRRRFIEMLQSSNCPMNTKGKTVTTICSLFIFGFMCCTIGEAETVYMPITGYLELHNPADTLNNSSKRYHFATKGNDSITLNTSQKAVEKEEYLSNQWELKCPDGFIRLSDYREQAKTDLMAQKQYSLLINCINRAKVHRHDKLRKAFHSINMRYVEAENSAMKDVEKIFAKANIELLEKGAYKLPDGTIVIEDGQEPFEFTPVDYLPLTDNYENRPFNDIPIMERDKSPNYDALNEHTWPVYTNVYKVKYYSDKPEVYRGTDCTFLVKDTPIGYDYQWFWASSKSMLVDSDGNKYNIRYLEHFPLDTYFWIHKLDGFIVRLIYVFPALPEEVTHVNYLPGTIPTPIRLGHVSGHAVYEGLEVKKNICSTGKDIF